MIGQYNYGSAGRLPSNASGGLLKMNRKLAEISTQKIYPDYEDRVACNCSILEVIQVYEGAGSQPKDTIFMGTYDGHLYSMRMMIKSEGNNEIQHLTMIKKWNLSGPVLSLISFSINNTIEDPNQQ